MTAETGAGVVIRRLSADDVGAQADALAALLIDAVEGGASVSFLAPLAPLDAIRWVLDVADSTRRGVVVVGAELDGVLVGTAQLQRAWQPNQPHRADVSKLLVHRRARGRGIGTALMAAVEAEARAAGLTLLTLDTASGGDGRRLYDRLGYTRVGEIPNYALNADGALAGTTIYYKLL